MGLREEVEKLADSYDAPNYLEGITMRDRALALAVMELTLAAAARECEAERDRSIALRDEYANGRFVGADACAARIRSLGETK